ncbi:MAG TPA: hypothetical protein VNO22_15745 [Planctomycetota bacterium]|nr:hypothetical protein [Planctomycetota bacterium]
MAEEDAGIDRQKLLDEIVGLATPPPGSIAGPVAEPSAGASAEAAASFPAEGSGGSVPEAAAVAFPGLLGHRHEISALAMIFSGLVWLAAGLGAGQGTGVLIGTAFLAAGFLARRRARNIA